MEEDTFGKLEEQFSNDWSCSCGGAFESANIEVVSKTKNTLLARYSCQICGREQMVTIPTGLRKTEGKTPIIEIPKEIITCEDVLNIRAEAAKANLVQIRALAKKKTSVRVPGPKVSRR